MSLFIPEDRNYINWVFKPNIDIKNFDPIKNKMLVNDIITTEGINYKSDYRKMQCIPGILVLDHNSYGRENNRILYKCIPNDNKLPIFLIPYTDKNITFSKKKINKYILFKFDNWESKHPKGIITNTLGNVDNLDIFCDYQLYCKNIHYSIQKLNKISKFLINKFHDYENIYNKINSKYNIENRETIEVITIDPIETTDYDDAFSVKNLDNNKKIVSIYISNVPIILDILDLWNNLSKRVSSIYLPNKKISMLPNILSDNICSLIENNKRFVLALDIHIKNNYIDKINFNVCSIIVKKNYEYEDDKLLNNVVYKNLLKVSQDLNNERKYKEEIVDSHDVVEFYMIFMNHEIGKLLENNNIGIFRNVTCKKNNDKNISNEINNVLDNVKGSYELYNKGHQLIGNGVNAYAQITSPIRRLVDIINMILFLTSLKLIQFNNNAYKFLDVWKENLILINENIKKIKKVQNDCSLLSRCIYEKNNNCFNKYIGYSIDITIKSDKYKNTIYIPYLKLISYTLTDNKEILYSQNNYTLHMFINENTLKRKIRLQN